jgi:hypothetical protein
MGTPLEAPFSAQRNGQTYELRAIGSRNDATFVVNFVEVPSDFETPLTDDEWGMALAALRDAGVEQ